MKRPPKTKLIVAIYPKFTGSFLSYFVALGHMSVSWVPVIFFCLSFYDMIIHFVFPKNNARFRQLFPRGILPFDELSLCKTHLHLRHGLIVANALEALRGDLSAALQFAQCRAIRRFIPASKPWAVRSYMGNFCPSCQWV